MLWVLMRNGCLHGWVDVHELGEQGMHALKQGRIGLKEVANVSELQLREVLQQSLEDLNEEASWQSIRGRHSLHWSDELEGVRLGENGIY